MYEIQPPKIYHANGQKKLVKAPIKSNVARLGVNLRIRVIDLKGEIEAVAGLVLSDTVVRSARACGVDGTLIRVWKLSDSSHLLWIWKEEKGMIGFACIER